MSPPRHIVKVADRSRRIDLYPEGPSVVFSVPPGHRQSNSVNEVARVDVDRIAVPFVHLDRHTVRLAIEPPKGSMVSLYFVHPADHSLRLLDYLRQQDTEEEHRARLLRLSQPRGDDPLGAPRTAQAAHLATPDGYGLQRPANGSGRAP